MKVTIVFPFYLNYPVGGYNVHYKYANILADKGHSVTLVFPRKQKETSALVAYIKAPLWKLKTRLRNKPLISSFKISSKVSIKLVADLRPGFVPSGEVLVATHWETAEMLKFAPERCGKKFYIVYDYEIFKSCSEKQKIKMAETYIRDFRIIATSDVVKNMVEQCGGIVECVIPCGMDVDTFYVETDVERRNKFSIGFPARQEAYKGLDDAVQAVSLLRERFGDELDVVAFGRYDAKLPSWIKWLKLPNQETLRSFYNSRSIFIQPSHFEGWGLPGSEAMLCGCALVTTDNGGCRDYARNLENCLMVEPHQPAALAEAVTRLILDTSLKNSLAHNGLNSIKNFRWETSGERMESVLLSDKKTL